MTENELLKLTREFVANFDFATNNITDICNDEVKAMLLTLHDDESKAFYDKLLGRVKQLNELQNFLQWHLTVEKEKKQLAIKTIEITKENILSKPILEGVLQLKSPEREFEIVRLEEKARSFGASTLTNFKKLLNAITKAKKQVAAENSQKAFSITNIPLKMDYQGKVEKTIDNFYLIINADPKIAGIVKYDELKQAPINFVTGKEWTDEDDAELRWHIEKVYGVRSKESYEDAMLVLCKRNKFNPIVNIIDNLVWDGQPRIKTIFQKWLLAEDTEYTSAVALHLFSGGIYRAYEPGTKFDEMPIFIGKQGGGKSTFARWLAIQDKYFNEITEFEGQKGIEALQGNWIVEVSELLALTKKVEVEAVKGFISRVFDKYRMPYARRVSAMPRRCLFIGTTNKQEFLTDKTGNRRFLPVKCFSDAATLYNNEAQVKEDILQCWAEAKALYDKKLLPLTINKKLIDTVKQKQTEAMEEDWRIGKIETYIETHDKFCVMDLWKDALGFDKECTRRDSNEVVDIMQNFTDFERTDTPRKTTNFGSQRIWHKKTTKKKQIELIPIDESEDGDLPF